MKHLVVTGRMKEQQKRELLDLFTKLGNARYRLSGNKTEFLKSETEWVGTKLTKTGLDRSRIS